MDSVGQIGLEPILRLIDGELSGSGVTSEQELCTWGPDVWAQVMRQLPIDAYTFLGELEHPWETVTAQLDRWCRAFHQRPGALQGALPAPIRPLGAVYDHPGVAAPLLPVPRARPRHGSRDHPRLRRPVRTHAGAAAVQEALRVLYAPDPAEDNASTHEEWDRIDFSSLRFHRHGTTSFILVGDSVSLVQGRRRPLALKCILFPFLRVSRIVGATATTCPGMRRPARIWVTWPMCGPAADAGF